MCDEPVVELKPHQERVLVERDELEEKVDSLTSFIEGDVFLGVGRKEQVRLIQQLGVMQSYLYILNSRILEF